MRRPLYIQKEAVQVGTIEGLTSVFESIASIHIAQIKDTVMSSTAFFNELWQIYTQLRVDDKHRKQNPKPANQKAAIVAITSDGGLIGDIDDRIVNAMLKHPGIEKMDVYVIGSHGVALLARRGIKPKQAFALPEADKGLQIAPITEALNAYGQATVYYQTYVSLLRQDIARINLVSAVNALGETASKESGEVISPRDYIFEPSLADCITYMESVMRGIALGQVVLESKLAQYASRFNTMSAAKHKASDMRADLKLQFSRSKRAMADERIKETINAMRAMRHTK